MFPKLVVGITMSKFSGKCDVYDHTCEMSDEEICSTNFYLSGSIVPLRIDSRYDLIPFYPYIVTLAIGNKSGGRNIYFSRESYVDEAEHEFLATRLENCLRYYNQCKRKHIPYDYDEAVKKISFFNYVDDANLEIARRVEENGKKANIEGLHLPMPEHYRHELLDEMVKAGWDEKLSKYWIWHDFRSLIED